MAQFNEYGLPIQKPRCFGLCYSTSNLHSKVPAAQPANNNLSPAINNPGPNIPTLKLTRLDTTNIVSSQSSRNDNENLGDSIVNTPSRHGVFLTPRYNPSHNLFRSSRHDTTGPLASHRFASTTDQVLGKSSLSNKHSSSSSSLVADRLSSTHRHAASPHNPSAIYGLNTPNIQRVHVEDKTTINPANFTRAASLAHVQPQSPSKFKSFDIQRQVPIQDNYQNAALPPTLQTTAGQIGINHRVRATKEPKPTIINTTLMAIANNQQPQQPSNPLMRKLSFDISERPKQHFVMHQTMPQSIISSVQGQPITFHQLAEQAIHNNNVNDLKKKLTHFLKGVYDQKKDYWSPSYITQAKFDSSRQTRRNRLIHQSVDSFTSPIAYNYEVPVPQDNSQAWSSEYGEVDSQYYHINQESKKRVAELLEKARADPAVFKQDLLREVLQSPVPKLKRCTKMHDHVKHNCPGYVEIKDQPTTNPEAIKQLNTMNNAYDRFVEKEIDEFIDGLVNMYTPSPKRPPPMQYKH